MYLIIYIIHISFYLYVYIHIYVYICIDNDKRPNLTLGPDLIAGPRAGPGLGPGHHKYPWTYLVEMGVVCGLLGETAIQPKKG